MGCFGDFTELLTPMIQLLLPLLYGESGKRKQDYIPLEDFKRRRKSIISLAKIITGSLPISRLILTSFGVEMMIWR